jgi:crotonobetainyl-CoA:carnitine CoA-transferase CaiB-like acyl-CoA transferase
MAVEKLKVVDFSTHMSGPLASQLLLQLGADVVKIENPKVGDGNRGLPPLIHGAGMFHHALSSGTRSVAIDRRSPEWTAVVTAAAVWADVVIVGSRPSDAARRGLDFASLVKANPNLVYCAISGYGEAGPWQEITAHGLNPDAFAGLVPTEWADGHPAAIPSYQSIGAPLSGVFAALGILAAVRERDQGAGARYVHCSLWEAAMWFSWRNLSTFANLGEAWPAYRNLGSRYAMYGTSDHRAILVCPVERHFWERFVDLAQLPEEWKHVGDWSVSGMYHGTGPEEAEERRKIQARIGERSLADWVATLTEAEIPFAPVLTIAEALAGEHAAVNGVMRTESFDGHEVSIPSIPVRVVSAPGEGLIRTELLPPPGLGEDTDNVLTEWGVAGRNGRGGV